jgi:hypothetical protein
MISFQIGLHLRRYSQIQSLIEDSFICEKKNNRGFCFKSTNKNKKRMIDLLKKNYGSEIVSYEEVALYKPPKNKKRPIVLVGPHSIGRHDLR